METVDQPRRLSTSQINCSPAKETVSVHQPLRHSTSQKYCPPAKETVHQPKRLSTSQTDCPPAMESFHQPKTLVHQPKTPVHQPKRLSTCHRIYLTGLEFTRPLLSSIHPKNVRSSLIQFSGHAIMQHTRTVELGLSAMQSYSIQ